MTSVLREGLLGVVFFSQVGLLVSLAKALLSFAIENPGTEAGLPGISAGLAVVHKVCTFQFLVGPAWGSGGCLIFYYLKLDYVKFIIE